MLYIFKSRFFNVPASIHICAIIPWVSVVWCHHLHANGEKTYKTHFCQYTRHPFKGSVLQTDIDFIYIYIYVCVYVCMYVYIYT